MEGHLLIAQLAVLLEQSAAGSPSRPVSLTSCRCKSPATNSSRSRWASSHCDIAFSGLYLGECRDSSKKVCSLTVVDGN